MPDDQATPPVPPAGTDSPTTPVQPGDAVPQALTIDGVAYTPDQVKELLKTKGDYEHLQPEFTKARQTLSNPDALKAYIQAQYPNLLTPPAAPSDEEAQLAEAEKVLRGRGFVTKDEVMAQIRQEQQSAQLTEGFKSEIATLKKEWDGQGGKPKFDVDAVSKHMLDNGYPSLTAAFRDLHWDALQEFYAASKRKPNAPVIAAPGGGGAAPVTPDKGVDISKRGAIAKDFENFMATRGE